MSTYLNDFAARAGGHFLRRAAVNVFLLALPILVGCGDATPKVDTPPPAAKTAAQPAAAPTPALSPASKPEIGLANADKVKQLVAAAKGKVVVVNVWATFCIPCIEEMPELAQFYKDRDPQHVEFLSFSADPPYSIEDAVKPFAAEKDLPFPVYVLDELPPDDLIAVLRVGSTGWGGELPATFVFDSTGALQKSWLERVHRTDLSAAVAAIVAQ